EAGIAEGVGIKQPLRVIIDAKLKTPPAAKTLTLPGEVLVLTTRSLEDMRATALRRAGATVEQVAGDAEHCDLGAVLERLGAHEINDVLIEAGAGLNGALLQAGLIDELIIYMAPRLLGDSARGMFSVPALESLGAGWSLELDDCRRVGPDLRLTARVSRVAAS
ncbi:MAG TPA: RibD family protein, partial [Gammaproteobacteria bacterium]|nr:RibD family protein [Gammaproteobacteria bacterium]